MAAYDGHASKRQRTDFDGHGVPAGNRDRFDDPHKPDPSPVVHVRGLPETAIEADIVEACQSFGPISYVTMMPKRHQALIEFENMLGAEACVSYSQHSQIFIAGQPCGFNFSTSQKIQRPEGGESKSTNKILLFTILNPQYPISVDVMHTICSPSGDVQRIIIFKKNGVQAMVEFDTIDSALRAKQALNGADIYSGCCTLKIEYAKPTKLNIYKNDSESWDYTNPGLGPGGQEKKNAPLLKDPTYGSGPVPFNENDGGYDSPRGPPGPPVGNGRAPAPMSPRDRGYGGPPAPAYGDSWGREHSHRDHDRGDGYGRGPAPSSGYGPPPSDYYGPPRGSGYGPPPHRPDYNQQDRFGGPPNRYDGHVLATPSAAPPSGQQGSVLMLYGLHKSLNCDKIFNLFCLYGNIVRVKFLKSKEGVGMIQMGDYASCERATANLSNSVFYESKLSLAPSKQAFLQDVPHPHKLEDDQPSFKDFMGNRNNRFSTPEMAQKNRIEPPSKVLHFYNAPPKVTEEELREIFVKAGCKPFNHCKLFPSKSERSATGLLEWESKGDAIEAIICANHFNVDNPNGQHPFIFKLCFSSSAIISRRERQM
ncbi:unnamed protein product [Owenia fusiformis]|uniref:Uncharacterized protein n=1 Tax=Owenia fusiformis TaxID=6347 RepID=A0A8J1XWY2_OWEFU|nr:unnamed protein product [Owenia fusiformis]